MRRQKGSGVVEFTLVGIPMVFVLISVVEMARGMWIYHSQAYAVNEGVRYVVVHGAHCASNGNSCTLSVGQIASHIASVGTGLATPSWNVTLYSATKGSVSCSPLSSCLTNNNAWPQSPDNAVGASVAIAGSYQFHTALSMFWPGSKPVRFGAVNLPAYAEQTIQF